MAEEYVNNHYVQKARLRHFSIKDGNAYQTFVIDSNRETVLYQDIAEVFELERFYPLQMEKRLAKFENKAMKVLNKFLKGTKWDISRVELNKILRYILIQIYRTPQKVNEFKQSMETDPIKITEIDLGMLGLSKTDDDIKKLALTYMDEVLSNDWTNLHKSKLLRLRQDVRILDRFWPFITFSEIPLILNDNGLAVEEISGFKIIPGAIKNGFLEVFGQEFTDNQIEEEIKIRKWINCIILPLTPNRALILADDLWRLSHLNPIRLDDCHNAGFISGFIEKNGIVPIYAFINPNVSHMALYSSMDTLIDLFSNDDRILVGSVCIEDLDTHYLNALAYKQKTCQCVCRDCNELLQSMQIIKSNHNRSL